MNRHSRSSARDIYFFHGIVILFRDGIPQFRWWIHQKRSKDAGPEWNSETLGFGNKERDEPDH